MPNYVYYLINRCSFLQHEESLSNKIVPNYNFNGINAEFGFLPKRNGGKKLTNIEQNFVIQFQIILLLEFLDFFLFCFWFTEKELIFSLHVSAMPLKNRCENKRWDLKLPMISCDSRNFPIFKLRSWTRSANTSKRENEVIRLTWGCAYNDIWEDDVDW